MISCIILTRYPAMSDKGPAYKPRVGNIIEFLRFIIFLNLNQKFELVLFITIIFTLLPGGNSFRQPKNGVGNN